MNYFLTMGILQSTGYLLYILNDGIEGKAFSALMTLSQGTIGGVVHHQKRCGILQPKV